MDLKNVQNEDNEDIIDPKADWIKEALDSVGIISSAYLPVMGGLLVHIKGEGIIWIPRARVAGILSRSGLLDTMARQGALVLGLVFAPIATAYAQFVKRGFRIPPNIVSSYSKSAIDRVLINRPTLYQKVALALGGAKDKLKSVIKKEREEKEDSNAYYYVLRIINKLEEITLEEGLDSIKGKLDSLSLPLTSEAEFPPSELEIHSSPSEIEFAPTISEKEDRTGKLGKISKVKDRAVEKLKVAKDGIGKTGTIAKDKLIGVKTYVSEKLSKENLQKVIKWLQTYPLFRISGTKNEIERLNDFLKSLQEDEIEVYSALELEDTLTDSVEE